MIEIIDIGGDKERVIAEIMDLLFDATHRLVDNAETDFQFPLDLEEVVDIKDTEPPESFIYLISDIVCDILRVDHGSRFFANDLGGPTRALVYGIVTADQVEYGQNLSLPQLERTLARLRIFLEIR